MSDASDGQDRGVLTFAFGARRYAWQANALARSIRLRTPGMRLAVATDLDPAVFRGLFDIVIPWPFRDYPGTTAKFSLPEITPFETTLFIDSDCLCIRPLTRVFDYFGDSDFAVYGSNTPDYFWAKGSSHIRSIVDAPSYPSFNGGLYFFRRSPLARQVFAKAADYSARFDTLGIDWPRRRHNDEAVTSLAMASLGIKATDDPRLVIMVAPERPKLSIDIDILAGRCRFKRRDRWVEPEIVHFVGRRSRIAAYRRERMVLARIASGGWPRRTRPFLALAARTVTGASRCRRAFKRMARSAPARLLREPS